MVGTSTCIMAIANEPALIPGVCGVVPGSIHPATPASKPDSRRPATSSTPSRGAPARPSPSLSQGLENYRAGQTGLLRLTWDNGDRTVLVNPELGGVTLGWNLTHTAQDELFAAIEGTAFHTRVILERMEEHGVPIRRVINGGGIPQKNEVLNRVYANVLNKPVLVPRRRRDQPRARRSSRSWRRARSRRSRRRRTRCAAATAIIEPEPCSSGKSYEELYALYRKLYFGFGCEAIGAGGTRRCAAANCAGSPLKRGVAMNLEALREEVLEANLELVRRGLVLYTFGNASGIDREQRLVVIKPSGVPYEKMTPDQTGGHRSRREHRGRHAAAVFRPRHAPRAVPRISQHRRRGAHALALRDRVGAGRREIFRASAPRTPITSTGPVPVTDPLPPEEIQGGYEANTGPRSSAASRARTRSHARRAGGRACAVLLGTHAAEAAHTAVIVEEIAHMAFLTVTINAHAEPLPDHLRDKHFLRKHGSTAYYGQPRQETGDRRREAEG